MSNTAQTWTILGAGVALLGLVIGLQTYWVARSLDRLEARVDRLEAAILALHDDVRQVKDLLLRDYGERLARLEEKAGAR